MNQNLFKPTYLKELCATYNLSPSKKYGQNYLISSGVIEKIVDAAQIVRQDTVVEVGPGFGVLTLALAERAERVVAFEIERTLKPYWHEVQKEYDNVDIVWGNALKNLQGSGYNFHTYKVVANLPYQITSHILRTILEAEQKPTSVTVMVQKEVAQRICAKPGDMSMLAVSVQYYGVPRIAVQVPKGNFWPQPKVDSAVVHIDLTEQEGGREGERVFFRVVRAGFTNKRKQVWRNISEGLALPAEKVKSALEAVTGNEKIRAQELSLEMWKALVTALKP